MSNQLKNMQKVLNLDENRQQKQQLELQRQSFVMNTRLRLAETFLNTLLGRADLNINDVENISPVVDMSIDYANALMVKLGVVVTASASETN